MISKQYDLVDRIELVDKKEWEKFVLDHPSGNVFQLPQMYEVFNETYMYEPIFVVAREKSHIVGVLLAVIQKVHNGILGWFSARSVVMGGPLVMDNGTQIAHSLLKHYNEIIRSRAIYSQFRNFGNTNPIKTCFLELGFNYIDHLNILINLNSSKEELWEKLDPKKKNRIRKANKEQLEFSLEESEDSLIECYDILQEVYQRIKLPLPHISFFQCMKRHLGAGFSLLVFAAKFEGKIISTLFSLTFQNVIYSFYSGAYSQYYNKCPNAFMWWEGILWAKANGFSIFDFGGAGHPSKNYGVRDFKKKFGGEVVEPGRYEKIHQPFMYLIGKRAFSIWRLFKS